MGDPIWYVGPDDDPRRYQLWRQVGGGAEGRVWQATATLSDGDHVQVAVKVLNPERFDGLEPPARVAQRWMDQALRLRNLGIGDGVVPVQEAFVGPGLHHGTPDPNAPPATCFVMGWVEGESLATWAASRPKGAQRLIILEAVADGLDRLHAAGAVHADIKPANVLVTKREIPGNQVVEAAILVDFGLMRAITGEPPSMAAGTPGYWAPEVRPGSDQGVYSPASDLYSFAALVTFLLAGRAPPDVGEVQAAARRSLVEANVPDDAADLIIQALDPDPSNRPPGGVRAWLSGVRSGLTSSMVPTRADPLMASAAGDPASPTRGGGSRGVPLLVVLLLLVGAAVAAAVQLGDRDGNPSEAGDGGGPRSESPTTDRTTTTREVTTTSVSTTTTTPVPAVTRVTEEHIAETFGAYVGPTTMNGQDYTSALLLVTCCDREPRETQLNAGRRFTRFKADVGIPDEERAHYRYRVDVAVDGRPIETFEVGFGETYTVDYIVTDALRIEIVMAPLFEDGLGALSDRLLAFANARFEE